MSLFWGVFLLIIGLAQKSFRKYLLSFIMLNLMILLFDPIFLFNSNYALFLHWENISFFSLLSIFPLFQAYLTCILHKEHFSNKTLLSFIPALVISIFSLVLFLLMNQEEQDAYIKYILYRNEDSLRSTSLQLQKIKIHLILLILANQIMYFTSYSINKINMYKAKCINAKSSLFFKMLLKFRNILIPIAFIIALAILFEPFGRSCILTYSKSFSAFFILYGVLIFLMGYWDYKYDFWLIKSTSNSENLFKNHNDCYKLTEKSMPDKITELFEKDEIFTNMGLKINDVAKMLCTNRTYVSSMINTTMNTSFTDLVNEYRVRYAKKLLTGEIYKDMSITEIRKMAGFSSNSSFHRIFKQKTGITPLDYKRYYYRKKGSAIL